jgi:hypothetical protein
MGRLKSGIEYEIKLVRGQLFLQGRQVPALIDHDAREIQVSDLVPVGERLDVVEIAMAIADEEMSCPGPFAHVHSS